MRTSEGSETKLDNGITIFSSLAQVKALTAKVMMHPKLWTD